MEMASSSSSHAAVEAIHRALSDVSVSDDRQYAWENARRFSGYVKRMHFLVNQLLRSTVPENLPPSVLTALKGITVDLTQVAETLAVYKHKSKIFVLINCLELCASLQERTLAIAAWLALLGSAVQDDGIPDLQNKIADLSRDMKQAHFRVTENEERVYCTLKKEGQGRQCSKAVQGAMVMDLARALGIDSNNHLALADQVKLLRNDIGNSSSISDRRILTSLAKIVENWAIQPDILTQKFDFNSEEEGAQLLPFKNFLCPLTKEIMKSPVVLESAQTYEKTAINYWFERCLEDGREPTCPVTGVVLKSLELKPNIGLAGAIDEWVTRNIEVQIKRAVEYLSEDSSSMDSIDRSLDSIYKISEEHPMSRYRVRNEGIVVLILKLLRNSSKVIGSLLKSKALMVLFSMAKDEESRVIMLAEGITRSAIHGLIGSSEKEREFAVRLLLDFSSDEDFCIKIASEKGALVLLSCMADNLENRSLSHLAEEVLKRIEKVEQNVEHLAVAGRFEPLMKRLCEGPDDVKIEMASVVGRMTLTNSSKEQIACQGARSLVELLSNLDGRAASLQALYNISCFAENATILTDSAVLPALTEILFENQVVSLALKALAASIIANIVMSPGHWELASADKAGHPLQSESIISSFLGLLLLASPPCQLSVLQILYRIASSPQASESVTTLIRSGDGIKTIITFLERPEIEHRNYALRLTRVLSERFGEELASALRTSNKFVMLKDKVLDSQSRDGERSDAACILANLSLSENEVKTMLGTGFIKWIVSTLKGQHCSTNGRSSRSNSTMAGGLLGLLLHFCRSSDPQCLGVVKEHQVMTIFRDQLVFASTVRMKQLAALGLKYLSESGMSLAAAGDFDPSPPQGFCSSFFICTRALPAHSLCPIHATPCEEGSQLCLLKSNCIKPLVDALSDRDTTVQVAALEALSTLLQENPAGLKRAMGELESLGMANAVVVLFTESRPGELQEKAIGMVDKMLRADSFANRQSLNQSLVRALVEAFKYGSVMTKSHAQDALTSLKQISGVSGQPSSQSRGQR
ncbi:U-box domain-containing protein 44 [Coffea arabica]|uniref:RING-type E3 ubiquitin transferase n=1 Tax=Coffea arabica TaxID=13443 RepID=A0A6P6W9K7_COFAR|nr:U-box domain-containing protein 44-like [Coffea arabica]